MSSSFVFSLLAISCDRVSRLFFASSSSLFFVARRISLSRSCFVIASAFAQISWYSFSSFSEISFVSSSISFRVAWISFVVLSKTKASLLIFVSIVCWCSNFILFFCRVSRSCSYSVTNCFSCSRSFCSWLISIIFCSNSLLMSSIS